MSPDHQNRRGRRTRALLRAALAELVEERGLDAVTVGEISERAHVTRTAFYRHFRDKQHMVDRIVVEAIGHVDPGSVGGPTPARERLRQFFDHIAEHDRLFRALLGPHGSPLFASRLGSAVVAACCEHVIPDGGDDLVVGVLGAMVNQTILWWLHSDRRPCSDTLAGRYLEMAGALHEQVVAERCVCRMYDR